LIHTLRHFCLANACDIRKRHPVLQPIADHEPTRVVSFPFQSARSFTHSEAHHLVGLIGSQDRDNVLQDRDARLSCFGKPTRAEIRRNQLRVGPEPISASRALPALPSAPSSRSCESSRPKSCPC